MALLDARAPERAGGRDWFDMRHDAVSGIEALRCRLDRLSYDRHCHDGYAIGLTEAGSQSFYCRGATHRTRPGSVILFNPFDLHDGGPTSEAGVVYRMLYVGPDALSAALDDGPASWREPGFRMPIVDRPELAAAIVALAHAIEEGDPLGRGEALVVLARALSGAPGAVSDDVLREPAVERVAERLASRLDATPSIEDLAKEAGLDRFRLIRAFKRRYGVAPSVYLRTLRLEAARRLLASGERPAAVAAETGFSDQSHLNRWFLRAYAMTPGAFVAALRR